MNKTFKWYIKRTIKVIAFAIGVLLILLLIGTLIFQLPKVQNYVADLAVKKVEEKTGVAVTIDKIAISLYGSVNIKNFFAQDNKKDTLLFAESLKVKVSLLKILNKKIHVNKVQLDNAHVRIVMQDEDSTMNFSPYIKAFQKPKSTKVKKQKSEKNKFSFILKRIQLDNVRFLYQSIPDQNIISANTGELEIKLNTIDLKEKVIEIKSVSLQGSALDVLINSKKQNQKSKPFPFHINLQKDLTLQNVSFLLQDNFGGQKLAVNGANLSITSQNIDLRNKNLNLDEIELFDTHVEVRKFNLSPEDSAKVESLKKRSKNSDFDWKIKAGELKLENNSFAFSQENHSNKKNKVNYSDFRFYEISGLFEKFEMYRYFLAVSVQDFSVAEKSGFKLTRFATDFKFSEKQTNVSDLILETPYSRIVQTSLLKYKSVEKLREDISQLAFEININSSSIGIADLNYLLPQNVDSIPYVSQLKHKIKIATKVSSYSDTLRVDNLKVAYDSTSLHLKGYVANYMQISDSTFADIGMIDLKTTQNNIMAFLPDTILPDQISLPSNIKLNTNFRGTKNIFRTQSQLITDFGEIVVNAQINSDSSVNKRSYYSELELKDFNLGKLFSNDSIGKITQYTTVSGTLSPKKYSDATANLKTNIKSFDYLNYLYTDIKLNGTVTQEKIKADIAYADSSLIVSASGMFKRNDSVPGYELDMNLEGVDLQALHISSSGLKGRGQMKAKFSGTNLNNSNGELVLSDVVLLKNNELYNVDSVKVLLTNKSNKSQVKLSSSFITADYSGTIKPGDIYPSLKKHFSQYLPWDNDTLLHNYDTGEFQFSLKLSNSEIITKALFPNLKSILPSSLNSKYNAETNQFSLHGDFPHIKYSNVLVDDLNLRINTNDSTDLTYNLSFEEVNADPVVLGKTELVGKAIADSLKFMLRVPGDKSDPKYILGAYLTQQNGNPKIGFISDYITLNYKNFNLPDDNYMLLTSKKAEFHNMKFSYENQQLQILNDTSEHQEYIVELSNFEISNISELVETETEIINGVLDGKVSLENREHNKLFNADVKISNMFVNDYKVFDRVNLKANNVKENRIEINSTFLGAKDELEMQGYISRVDDENYLDFDLDIKELNLIYFETFTADILEDLEGVIRGNVQIQGNSASPELNGELSFKDISVKPDYLNTTLNINNQKLTIKNNRATFNKFTLSDFENNKTEIDGFVDFRNFKKPNFNLSVSSNNFRFLNTKYREGRLYYGKVRANLSADITGNPEQPNINLTVYLGDNSEFHFVIPELTDASIEEEGVVRFVNEMDTVWTSVFKREPEIQDSLQALSGTGISLSANVEIDAGMDIYIEIDPASNEELFLNGNANLSFQKRRAETPTLSGRFEIQDGTYTLTLYEVIRRTFSIEKGSYLVWNGNVQNPVTDITTIYQVRTSPVPLISNETADFGAESTSQYSNNTPFLINLNIEGELLKPELNFQLETPPGQSDALIQAKLAQLNQNESQLHKQVFSLLLFNSFIESTSASNRSTAYELNATARTSVSKLLTRQISSFADRYVKYVDVDVGVNSYYNRVGDQSSGQTEVSLDVSKRLLNDKLKVQVGGDFNVENRNTNDQKQGNSNIAGDFVVEYKLDEDGTYRIQGFNKTEYEDFFDGEVNKTGAAFIFNKDFYKLNQLFKSDTTKNKKRQK